MAKKKEVFEKEEVDFIVEAIVNEPVSPGKLSTVDVDFGSESLNKLRDVVNALVERVNNL